MAEKVPSLVTFGLGALMTLEGSQSRRESGQWQQIFKGPALLGDKRQFRGAGGSGCRVLT